MAGCDSNGTFISAFMLVGAPYGESMAVLTFYNCRFWLSVTEDLYVLPMGRTVLPCLLLRCSLRRACACIVILLFENNARAWIQAASHLARIEMHHQAYLGDSAMPQVRQQCAASTCETCETTTWQAKLTRAQQLSHLQPALRHDSHWSTKRCAAMQVLAL